MASEFDFLDGFEDRVSADITKKFWSSLGFPPHLDAGAGRWGGQAFVLDGLNGIEVNYGGTGVRGSSGFTSKIGIGAAVKIVSNQGTFGGASIFATGCFGTNGVSLELHFTRDGRFSINRAGAGILAGAISDTSFPIFLNTFYFIEWEVTFHESAVDAVAHTIDFRVAVEGVEVLNISGYDLGLPTASGNLLIQPVLIRLATGQETGFVFTYSDIYFRTAGIFVCGAKVLKRKPTADSLVEWDLPSSGDHYIKVDEDHLDITDFVEATSAPVRDIYVLEDTPVNLPSTRALRMAQWTFYGDGSESDGVTVRHILRNGGDVNGTLDLIVGKYTKMVVDSDPFSASDYLASEFDATDAGVHAKVF